VCWHHRPAWEKILVQCEDSGSVCWHHRPTCEKIQVLGGQSLQGHLRPCTTNNSTVAIVMAPDHLCWFMHVTRGLRLWMSETCQSCGQCILTAYAAPHTIPRRNSTHQEYMPPPPPTHTHTRTETHTCMCAKDTKPPDAFSIYIRTHSLFTHT